MTQLERLEKAFLQADEAVANAVDTRIAALQALNREKERLALEGVGAPFPIGTRMRCTYGSGAGLLGVIEAVTKESYVSKYDYKPGRFIIRKLKKDGTPGTRYETPDWDGTFKCWQPVEPASGD